jgi:putative transposase
METFLQVFEQGILQHNARKGRRTEMARGRDSFDEVFERSYAVSPIGKATEEQLRMALLAADQVRADRKTGAVKVLGNSYWCQDLTRFAGQLITVRFDPEDATKPVHVYDGAGRFAATADMWESTGFLDAEAARRRSKLEGDHRKATKAAAQALSLLSATSWRRCCRTMPTIAPRQSRRWSGPFARGGRLPPRSNPFHRSRKRLPNPQFSMTF